MRFVRNLCALVFLGVAAFSADARAAIGDLVATLSATGLPSPVFTLSNNPNGYFTIQNGNQLVQAVNTPPGTYSIGITATVPGTGITRQFVLSFTAPIVGNLRITNTGDIRVTSAGDTRVVAP